MCPVCGCNCDGADLEGAIDHEDLIALTVAIRRGDREGAEYALDRMARCVEPWPHVVEVARYSSAARVPAA